MYTIKEVAHDIYNRLYIFDQEAGTDYSEKFPKKRIEQIIKKSLEQIKDKSGMLNEANRTATLKSFGVIKRKGTKSLRLRIEADKLVQINTAKINKSSLGVGSLRRDSTVFYDEYSIGRSEPSDVKLLKELEEDETLPKSAAIRIENKYNFKTPLNVVFASSTPERRFIKGLTTERTAKAIDAWIKSLDVGFYSIEYSWRKGEHPKQGSFNPDFFIKIGSDIIVVETKMDDDISDENKAKLGYAKYHFENVNKLQNKQKYYFKFLSPSSFDLFFNSLEVGTYKSFKSELEAKLKE